MKETKFKQTEVGMIPSDWGVEPLANIANTASGGTPSRSNEAFYKGSIKWFTTTELKDCNLYDSVEHISKQAVECSSAKIFPKDTLLMAMYGATIGKLGLLKCDAATNQACCAIFPKKTDVLYLYYFLLHNRENIIAMGCGAGQPNVSQEIVKKINIPLPPTIEEQQRIANALSDVDTLIANLEKLIAKKKNIKQGAMQQLLTGKKRLPGFGLDERTGSRPTDERRKECHSERSAKREESSGYKMTELGMIPSDWEVKTFGDVGKGFSAGATPYRQVDRYYEGDIKWVSSGELDYNVIQETQEHISIEAVKATNLTLHPKNTFLMAITGLEAAGTRGRCAILGCEATTNQSCLAIYESEYLSIPYLYHFYVKYGDALAFAYAQGSKQQSFTAAIVKKLPIILPSSKAEQTAIANVLSDMDTEISALETKLAKYRTLKTGMMQQLLTGKIRLL